MQQQLVELHRHGLRLGQVADADGAAGDLVLIGRADAAAGGADLRVAARRLARAVDGRMQRQDQRCALSAIRSRSGPTARPCACTRAISASSASGIDHHAVADDAELAAHQARRQQRELVGLVADHQRVAGIMAALEAHDDLGATGEPVDHLALALIAPLGADHGDIRHVSSFRSDRQFQRGAVAQDMRAAQPPRLRQRILGVGVERGNSRKTLGAQPGGGVGRRGPGQEDARARRRAAGSCAGWHRDRA